MRFRPKPWMALTEYWLIAAVVLIVVVAYVGSRLF
jgi:hypothetical protein